MDILGADFFRVVKMMKERLRANAVPIQLPIGAEENFTGIIDLVKMKAFTYGDDLGTQINMERYRRSIKNRQKNTVFTWWRL